MAKVSNTFNPKTLFCFFENNMLTNNGIILFVFNTTGMEFPTFRYGVSIARPSGTFNLYYCAFTITCHNFYSAISVTTPAPTVWPPSRIAKRSSLSMAIGIINSTSNSTLSPGMTISVPLGNVTTPVTSVVLK